MSVAALGKIENDVLKIVSNQPIPYVPADVTCQKVSAIHMEAPFSPLDIRGLVKESLTKKIHEEVSLTFQTAPGVKLPEPEVKKEQTPLGILTTASQYVYAGTPTTLLQAATGEFSVPDTLISTDSDFYVSAGISSVTGTGAFTSFNWNAEPSWYISTEMAPTATTVTETSFRYGTYNMGTAASSSYIVFKTPVVDKVWDFKQKVANQLRPQIRHRGQLLSPAVSAQELKARDTLRDMLTEAEWRRYCTNGFVMVRGSADFVSEWGPGPFWYQVFSNQSRTEVFKQGKRFGTLCIHTDRECPPSDHVINLKLLVEMDEQQLWVGSNMRRGMDFPQALLA